MVMRNLFLVIALLSFYIIVVKGESVVTGTSSYKFSISGHVTQNGSDCGKDINAGLQWIVVHKQDGSRVTLVRGSADYPDNGHGLRHQDFSGEHSFTKKNRLTTITYRTVYRGHGWLGGCEEVEPEELQRGLGLCHDVYYTFWGLNQPGNATEKSFPIVKLNEPVGLNQYISDTEYLTIALEDNIDDQFYNWEFSFDNTGSFERIPQEFNNRSTLKIKGEDFLNDDAIGRTVYIKVNMGHCAGSLRESNAISFTYLKSAPYIDSVSYQLSTCHKSDDAKLLVHLDRELLPSEKLYISAKGDRFVENRTIVGSNTKVIEIPELPADTFDIALIGSYQLSNGTTVATYTDGEKHKYSIRIPERPALLMTALYEAPVHCYGGKDGQVFVKAEGGNGVFDAFIEQNNQRLDSIRFTDKTTGVFKELSAGSYTVWLRDTNYCTLDALGNPVRDFITVSEPSDAVIILRHDSEEPKGFGLSNGWAQVTFKGGTSGNYQAVWKDSLDNIIPNTITPEGDTYISKVVNIRSSTYFVTIYDANYPLVDPRTTENLCGCTDTISFFVEEPPKLEVKVDEHHYVTCFGDRDGEIVAHARGGRPHTTGLPYTYEWEKMNGSVFEPVAQTDSLIIELYSGHYRVKVIDRNNISTYSEVYHLVQPEELQVKTKVLQNISCSGDSVGMIEAIASGGTPPYTYLWSTNDTTKIVSGLPQGNYVVGVRDARYQENILGHYCFVQAYDSIISPASIRLSADVRHPLCHAYEDGTIRLSISGGTPPYAITWEDGSTDVSRTDLPEGEYHVRVSDAKGCFLEESYLLIQPEPVVISLGGDLTLCKGQTQALTVQTDWTGLTYQWTDGSGKLLSTADTLLIGSAGTYRVKAQTAEGCMAEDEIRVSMSADEVHADFIIATRVAKHVPVQAVNITLNAIDSIRWILPEGVDARSLQQDKAELVFPRVGEWVVGMVAYKNDCRDILYKAVTVVDKSELGEEEVEEPFIKRFVVTPNPNGGDFQAIVELSEPADYRLLLYDSAGKLIETKQVSGKLYEATRFQLAGAHTGMYYLRLTSSKGNAVFQLIIN